MLPALRAANAKLVAYGHEPRGAAAPLKEARDVVELRGFVPTPEEAWEGVKRDCDVLVFPYLDPPGLMERMYSIHFPSKLTEYLAAGLPIVMVGPEAATGVRWARSHPQAVYLLDASAPESWSAEFERLASEAELRSLLAHGALEAAVRDFDPLAIREKFRSALREAAASKMQHLAC
jgi:glycosyltransferase involved in cell wall biosynthesis